jgi:hypothetical protein
MQLSYRDCVDPPRPPRGVLGCMAARLLPWSIATTVTFVGGSMFVTACHDDVEIPDENPECAWDGDVAEDPGLQVDAPEVQVGENDDEGVFIPWIDGDTVQGVGGGQGLVMLLPILRVVGAGEAMEVGDEVCLYVELVYTGPVGEDTDSGEQVDGGVSKAFVFTVSEEGDLTAGPLWAPFEGSTVNDVFDVHVRVRGDDFESTAELRVHAVGG